MHKWVKKVVTLGMAGVLATGLLVGCAAPAEPEVTESATPESTTEQAAQTSEPAGDAEVQTIQVAVLTGMAPYTYVDDAGEFQGYDYEYMKLLDEKLEGYEFSYNAVEPDAAAAAIQAGTYAFSVSAHFVTPAREANYLLSVANCYYPVNLISREEDNFQTFEDLDGAVMVPNPPNDGLYVVLHDMAQDYPDVAFTQEEVSNYVSYADSCRGVSNGTYDCWFGGDSMFYDVIESEPMDNLVISEPITCAPCVVVINKDMADLQSKINSATAELYEEGKLAELSEKWLGADVFKIAEETGVLADYASYK